MTYPPLPPDGGYGPPSGGYQPPGDYPPPGSYPPASGYPPPGGYPPPAAFPPPAGYPPVGAYPPPGYPAGYPPPTGTNGLAIASLVLSLLGLTCYGVTSVIGVILGIVAMNQVKQSGQEGRGMALAGVIIGGVSIALWVIGIILYVAFFASLASYSNY